ncbi:MAG: DUF554 domain-containing protein [Lachnospiraceae bacterium]|nr:DUF554 domain-containing protein [Lachnospiraceae bacterium]
MSGLGTLIDVALSAAGGIFGLLFGSKIKKSMQETLMMACGFSILFLAIGGTMSKMLEINHGTLLQENITMMMVSLALGSVIGELINIQGWIEKFGLLLKRITKSDNDNEFVNAFISSTCTVCIGAMAIVGSIEDAINGNYSLLLAKGILDFVLLCVLTASLGKGAIFASISILIFQGAVEILAVFINPILTPDALSNLAYVGNILIFAIGVNIIWGKDIRVANMLPSLIVAAIWAAF